MSQRRTKTRERLFTVAFMFCITFVLISLVSLAHLATRSTVKRNEALFLKRAVFRSAALPAPEDPAELERLFATLVEAEDSARGPWRIQTPRGSEGVLAYVVLAEGPGLWGNITAVVGFEPDGRTLRGVAFVEHTETPGLGARITEERFRNQFRGKGGPFTVRGEGQATRNDEIDGITGASITTRAVRDLLNRAGEEARGLAKKGNGD